MATIAVMGAERGDRNGLNHQPSPNDDPFMETDQSRQPYLHRFSSRFELDAIDLGTTSSPSQVKRVLEAHLLDTERRLQDTHKLGTSLLQQQSELQDKLLEVEQQQDEAEISPELKQRLASIGREHDDVSREIARSLLAPKSRAVSGEERSAEESTTLTSQATGSPTKISAPNRRQRNQPTNRAGDLQFAADISTSLLAQVRQLQAAVAERDEGIKNANLERSRLEHDVQIFSQKLRAHDENEQRFKDETWNLESQNHELLSAQRESADREKKLHATISLANAERMRFLAELEEFRLAHNKATEEHEAAKKTYESELHSLKRDFDVADSDRSSLQYRVDELTSQNQELAKAMSVGMRSQSPVKQPEFGGQDDELSKDFSTPEHSPPPSPTKATPRHGGLESETLKSSLHHAHRMIQNLKSNIHREKTEKIELKRMLQDARDELEQQRRNDPSLGSVSKKQRTRNEVFKKPPRPEMLGGSRRPWTDVEMSEGDWEDQANGGPSQSGTPHVAEMSDAYQTAHETESNFETADERMATESEAFMTGAESLAGDSTDDLTETEGTAPRPQQRSSARHNRPSFGLRSAGSRDSYLSTASTSAGEEENEILTPIQAQPHRFKMRNGRSSMVRQTQIYEGTPDSVKTTSTAQDSPATVVAGRSPPGLERSLFAELEGINDTSSNFSTPARSGIIDVDSPEISDTPSKSVDAAVPITSHTKPMMVDSATMTEPWQPELAADHTAIPMNTGLLTNQTSMEVPSNTNSRVISIGEFPLPPSGPNTMVEHTDMGTQYTPQKSPRSDLQTTPQHSLETGVQHTPSRALQDSPIRGNTFITPPKTVWDEEHESEIGSPGHRLSMGAEMPKPTLAYSGMLSQDTIPLSPAQPAPEPPATLAFSTILSQQTYPIAPPPSLPPKGPLPALPDAAKQDRARTEKNATGAAAGGLLVGAAAALGLSWAKDKEATPKPTGNETIEPVEGSTREVEAPLQDISGNSMLRNKKSASDVGIKEGGPVKASSIDQNPQIVLTPEEIDHVLQQRKNAALAPQMAPAASNSSQVQTSKSLARSPDLSETLASSSSAHTSPPLRPSSAASSVRPSNSNKQHPPLPSDYKSTIARANSLAQNAPLKRENSVQAVSTVMGPPIMPASAMRRPKTPAQPTRSPSRDNATPRTAYSMSQRANTESQLSHRSSVSSFASELNERFNMRAGAMGSGYEPAPGTDPRMIQAITQTMIGEYLWKYTRKPGSKDMSSTRHRRYFWVHPYTKTLYWSTTDPSLPGAKEGTSRSVPIESVRVVSDENPMPPGLHRKSLEVTTPSRKVKFTASTGQRHETWFNALSYLLLRGEPADIYGAYSTGGNEITRDDIDEFRASGTDPHRNLHSSMSMSSYNSRTTAGTSKRVSGTASTGQRQAMPSNVVTTSNSNLRHQDSINRHNAMPPSSYNSGRASRAEQPREGDKNRTIRANSLSRVSRMIGSITGRSSSKQGNHEQSEVQQPGHARGPSRESNSIYDASVVSATRDSAEETRQEMLRQENQGLENVRACCDGKHDVSTLSHSHRHSEQHRTLSTVSDRINRSMSKRI